MKNPIIYVFVNKGLHMSVGKVASQVGHAVAMSIISSNKKSVNDWSSAIHRTVIILEARDAQHIAKIQMYFSQRGFETNTIVDEGGDEIDGYEITATSSLILDKNSDDVIRAFERFKTYRDIVKITTEFER